ncbi:MAG: YwiC-like family protein [Chloroflexi bacterium]|nr:YwiC-like family protein [Chloroflexota bacterium]
MTKFSLIFRQQVVLPQDHGTWVFILCPLVIGLFAGGNLTPASWALASAAMFAFLIRQPITMAIKAYVGRRPSSDLPAARFWIILYGILILASLVKLISFGEIYILYLAIPAVPVFGWYLWLISRREERRQAGLEILATGVLALAAPAAYWIGKGSYISSGWFLWVLVWSQSAGSILYAYLRLEQRQWKSNPGLNMLVKFGAPALAFTTFNLIFSFGLASFKLIPAWIWLAFLIQFAETIWGTLNPAIGAKPVAVGIRQTIVTLLFSIIFISTWR